MAIYLTSDFHFNHNREFIFKARGFETVEDMNKTIVDRFNSVVRADDKVYILGDLCLGGGDAQVLAANKALIESLNGKLYIVRGNHDSNARIEMYKTCRNVVEVCEGKFLNYKGYHFYLSHFPTMTANLEAETLKQCTCSLYGHTHQTTNFYNDIPAQFHVGVDSHNCYPVLLDDIIDEMHKKVNECLALI